MEILLQPRSEPCLIHLLVLADDVAEFSFTRRLSVHGASLELATDVEGCARLRVAQSLEIFGSSGANLPRLVRSRPIVDISPDIMFHKRANAVDAAAAHLRSPLCPEPVGRAGSCFGFAVAGSFGGHCVASGRVKPAPVLVALARTVVHFTNGRADTSIRAHLFRLRQRGEGKTFPPTEAGDRFPLRADEVVGSGGHASAGSVASERHAPTGVCLRGAGERVVPVWIAVLFVQVTGSPIFRDAKDGAGNTLRGVEVPVFLAYGEVSGGRALTRGGVGLDVALVPRRGLETVRAPGASV